MKRIIFILTVILILSLPASALYDSGTPIQTIITGDSGNYFNFYMKRAIDESSAYCRFDGQPGRIKIIIEIRPDPSEVIGYRWVAEWSYRIDAKGPKFIYMGVNNGSFKPGNEESVACEIIDYTDILMNPEPSDDEDEYDGSNANTL